MKPRPFLDRLQRTLATPALVVRLFVFFAWFNAVNVAFQVGNTPRAIGYLGLEGVAFVLAVNLVWLGLGRVPGLARALALARPLAFPLFALNLLAIGVKASGGLVALSGGARAGLVAGALALTFAYFRNPAADRQVVDRRLDQMAGACLLLPIALLPLAAYGATRHASPGLAPEAELSGLAARAPRRIVLLSFDGMRAQSMGLYHPGLANTPKLTALARTSTVYEDCRAASGSTIPSLPALLSGRSPKALFGLMGTPGATLARGAVPGLADYLQAAGYRCSYETMFVEPRSFGMEAAYADGHALAQLAFPNVYYTRPYLSFGPAWEWLLEAARGRWRYTGRDLPRHTSEAVDQAIARLEGPTGPAGLFMWVHLGAPHYPFAEIPAADIDAGRYQASYPTYPMAEFSHLTDANRAEARGVYERYIRFVDAEAGRLVAALQGADGWRDTLLVVTSDHGESFATDGGHGTGNVDEGICRVPLLIHRPGQAAPARVQAPVGHLDLVPTVLARVAGRLRYTGRGVDLASPDASKPRVLFTWGRFAGRPPFAGREELAAVRGAAKLVVPLGDEGPRGERAIAGNNDLDGAQAPSSQAFDPATLDLLRRAAGEEARGSR